MHLDDMLSRIETCYEQLDELGEKCERDISIIAYAYEYFPPMQIDPEILRRLSAGRFTLDFDLYYLGSNDDESLPA